MPAPLIRTLVLTAAATWLAVRLAVGMLGYVQVSYLGTAGVAAVTFGTAWLDLRRNDELLLYANLGVSPLSMSAVVVAVAMGLELIVAAPISGLLSGQTALVPIP